MEAEKELSPTEIRKIRQVLNLTQEAFASRLGVTFSTVNRWEGGHRRPNRLALFQLDKLRREGLRAELPGDPLGGSAEYPAAMNAASTAPAAADRVAAVLRDRVIIFDPARPEDCLADSNSLLLPQDLGPLRSVASDSVYGRPALLIGARDGVILRPMDQDVPAIRFTFGNISGSGLGTNSVAVNHGCLYATHSETGLWRWRLDEPTAPERLFGPLLADRKTVRSVSVLDRDRMMFLADGDLFAFSRSATTPDLVYSNPDGSRLSAARLFEHKVYIAAGDGRVSCFDLVFRTRQTLMSCERNHLYSARIARNMGRACLVLGLRRPFVRVIELTGDAGSRTYESGGHGLRVAEATEGHVLATGQDRNHLFLWEAGRPESPVARIPVAGITGQRIQDLCAVRANGGAPR